MIEKLLEGMAGQDGEVSHASEVAAHRLEGGHAGQQEHCLETCLLALAHRSVPFAYVAPDAWQAFLPLLSSLPVGERYSCF